MEIELKTLERLTKYNNKIEKCLIFNNLNIINDNNNIEFINNDLYENIKNKVTNNLKYDLILDNCKLKNICNILSLYDNLINLLNINGVLCLIIDSLSIYKLSLDFYKCIFNLKYGMELIFIYNADTNDNEWYDLINNPELDKPKEFIIIMAIKKSNNILSLVDNEPDYNIIPNKNKIMFVTAFNPIDNSIDKYVQKFGNLIKNNINIVCYCENEIKTILNNELNFYNTNNYDKNNTFYKIIDSQTDIIKSELYINLISRKKEIMDPITYSKLLNPEYNIMSHNKIIFIERIKLLYPNYSNYAWIDFDWATDNIFDNFDWDLLPDKIQYASSIDINPDIIPNILSYLINTPDIIYSGLFFIPYNLVDWYLNKYIDMINFFECANIVDNDQSIVCQLYKKYPDYFNLYNSNNDKYKLLSIYGIKSDKKSDMILNENKQKKLKIGFHSKQLCLRGTSVALYDYAYYNKKIYNNESIIFYDTTSELNDTDVIEKFKKEFTVYGYNNFSEINYILFNENINYFYSINHGLQKDSLLSNTAKNLIHALYNIEPHGDKYAVISEFMTDDYNKCNNTSINSVPYMINLPDNKDNLRETLLIPENAIVIGRYGGFEQFNIIETFDAIKEILNIDNNIYFIFSNTKLFYIHPRIFYLNKIIDLNEKVKFINTCDAMIHARYEGEIFGLSIGEFSSLNKPIITCKTPGYNYHISILKDKGLYYHDKDSLVNIFKNMKLIKELNYDWNAYKDYTPENVMKKFMQVFIE